MAPSRLLWGLIVVSALARLAWASALGLGMDEAYHYLFLVHPDYGYFDHPPMLALVEGAGVALTGGRVAPLTLRLGFVLLFAGSTWLMSRLTARFFGPWAGLLAALALNVSAYHTAAAGAFVLPDGPLLFFWLLTLDRVAAALEAPDRVAPWVSVGLAWGGGMLSKYHAVFLPAGVFLYALLEPSARHLLRRAGPYLAAALGLALFAPVVAWNARHGWASFLFQGGRAVGSLRFRPGSLAGAVAGQAAYLFPWIWLTLVVLLIGRLRDFRRAASPAERFLACQAVVPLAVFTAVACVRPVLPHWTLVGYLSIFPLVGRAWAARLAADPARTRRRLAIMAAIPAAAMVLFAVQYRTGLIGQLGAAAVARLPSGARDRAWALAKGADPTADLYGWDQVAAEIRRRGLLDRPGTFLFADAWFLSGQIAFAARDLGAPVLCYHPREPHNFAIWSRPDEWLGHDGVLVWNEDTKHGPRYFERYFERMDPPIRFTVTRRGAEIRRMSLYRCVRQVAPFPFGFKPG